MKENMFDVLLYLFHNYFEIDLNPGENILTQELAAAGFDNEEIHQAFDWLSGLHHLASHAYPDSLSTSRSMRYYADSEAKIIGSESRGLLISLEVSGILNPLQREWVIDRVLALSEREITLEHVKWIVLIVLWRQGSSKDYLFVEDLLFGNNHPQMH